nr:nitrilase-related carbon-nitrogen hydrolase [Subtercola sp. PAMC28395]
MTSFGALPSLSPVAESVPALLRVGLVQHRWHDDLTELKAELREGVGRAARLGAQIVFLPELTLSRYPADVPQGERSKGEQAEALLTGPTLAFAAELAQQHGVFVHASLYQSDDGARTRESDHPDGPISPERLGLNTAIVVSPEGELVGHTHKLHIPVTEGYYEDTYFRPGPAAEPYPVYRPGELSALALGMPTCWDEWFPEVARAYSLAGANLLVYPTAIGSEPGYPDFDTQPLWRQVIVGNGIANGLFMVVPNRWGNEGLITFYGSSFISDPYGRMIVQAPRDASAVLVADLDLQQRDDWLTLFPFLKTRRPDTYGSLVAPIRDVAIAGEHSA